MLTELNLLDERDEDRPKAACALMASRRWGRYLNPDWRGRPRRDAVRVKAVRYLAESRTIVQRTKIAGEPGDLLKKLGIQCQSSCWR